MIIRTLRSWLAFERSMFILRSVTTACRHRRTRDVATFAIRYLILQLIKGRTFTELENELRKDSRI